MRSVILLALLISCGGNAEVVRSSQAIPFVMGGSQLTFRIDGLPEPEEIEQIKCIVRFPDGRDSVELRASVPRDRLTAICRLPPDINSGSVDIDLEITTRTINTEILAGTLFINPSPLAEVGVKENWDANEVTFTWDPEYFAQFFAVGSPIMIQVTLYTTESAEPVFTPSAFIQVVGLNLGSQTVPISSPNIDRMYNVHYPYYYVLSAVGMPLTVFQSSLLFAPTLGMNDSLAEDTCSTWLQFAEVPAPPDEIHSCPPSLRQAELDANFIKTEYVQQIVDLVNGALNNHVLYYERVPTNGGHSQTCSYNTVTGSLASTSPAQAGWIHDVSKYRSYEDNYFADIWPYILCCLQTNSQDHCDLFHEKRPFDTGHEYPGPENPCKGTGDPHMVTFESIKFDFMGYGEFWLIRGPEGSEFGVQGRMSPLRADQKVSYYKAVAIRDGNTTIQIQIKAAKFEIFINGIEFRITTLPITLPLESASLTINGNLVDVRLQSGFTIIVENVGGSYFNVFGSGAHSNKGKGFMGIFGNFDDDAENDLTGQDGFVIPPTAANLKDLGLIHHRFGLTWMVTAEESFFVYANGKSWEDYANVEFGPFYEYPDPETLPAEVRAICGDSLFCILEYVGTDSLDEAQEIHRWEQEFDNMREEIETVIPMCDVVGPPSNGRVQVAGHLDGSLATYSCVVEYDFISGNRIRTCSASAETSFWNGVEPVCIWTCTTCLQSMEFELSHDPADCTKFFLCAFGERYSLDCPVLNTFNRETLVCTTDYECYDPPGC